MTRLQAEKLARHTGRTVMVVSALGNVGAAVFFALGFGFVTPQRTLAQLRDNDVGQRAAITALSDTVKQNEKQRLADRAEDRRVTHASLVIECLIAPPKVRERVNVDCASVLQEGAIR